MKIAIYGQNYVKHTTQVAVETLVNTLKSKNTTIFIEKAFKTTLPQKIQNDSALHEFKILDKSFDLLVSVGGDGTILRAITFVKELGIPIVGINTGRLGFLATIQNEEIEKALKQIVDGKFNISQRSLLSVESQPKNDALKHLNFALNEVTISRKNTTSMITVETHLDDEYLTSYWADGLILSTPTGSTGYSLSCGGPVITPQAKSFVLTPIAPHNLNARPLVIPDKTKISLKVNGREDQFLMSLDSRIITLPNTSTVVIKKADFKIKMVELLKESFLDTLRKKLLWGEDRRN